MNRSFTSVSSVAHQNTCREVRGCIPTPGHDFGPRSLLPRPLTRDPATSASSHESTRPPEAPLDPSPSFPSPKKTKPSSPGRSPGATRTRTIPEGPNGVPGASGHIEDREAERPGRRNPSTSGVQSRLGSTPPSGPPHPTRINS
ncbi:putative cuticle collagen 155 [Penaeus japonicus]|uniref:putative cuticle collagen 155 n=1 Tax=Penaeus japonicus TaxID=27405 RepID=UPI001C7157F4|nr:putative cuticle collagen 155 [Penaeus japonicus]